MSLREELKRKKEEENRRENEWIRAKDGTLILRKDCTIEDIEKYIMDNIFKLKYRDLYLNSEMLAPLIKERDENHILYKSEDTGSISFHDLNFEEFFADRYLDRIEPILWNNEMEKYFLNFEELPEEKFEKFKMEVRLSKSSKKVFSFWTKKENRACGEKVLKKIEENADEWNIIARRYFEPLVEELSVAYESIPYNEATFEGQHNISGYNAAMAIHRAEEKRRRLELALQKSGLTGFFDAVHFLPHTHLLLIKGNLICGALMESDGIIKIRFVTALGLNSRFELENKGGQSYTFEATTRPIYKAKSVIGHAMVGQLVGGAVGGVLGAASAMEANRRNAELVANYDPLIVDIKFDEINLNIINETTMTYERFYYISKTLLQEGELEKVLDSLKKARTHSACLQGELIKDFILDSPSNSEFSEDEFETFEKQKMDELKDLLVEKYPEFKEAYLKEKEMQAEKQSELENAYAVYREALDACTEMYSREKKRLEDDINNFESRLKQLGLFKGKEKRELSSQIETLNVEMQNAGRAYRDEKAALENKKNDMVRDVNERFKEYEDKFSPAVLYEKAILEEQEREFEKHIFIRAYDIEESIESCEECITEDFTKTDLMEGKNDIAVSEQWGMDVDTAVELALAELKCSRDEVEVTVLEQPSKGIFGIAKLARVRVEKK